MTRVQQPPPTHPPCLTSQGREESRRVHLERRALPLADDVRVETVAAQVG